jgi:RND family efflux transporter MFP subunit
MKVIFRHIFSIIKSIFRKIWHFSKKRKKTAILIAIVLIFILYSGYKSLFKDETNGYILEKVDHGQVVKNVSETGSVKATENIDLSFKSVGRIERINVAVGDNVKAGEVVAKMETYQLSLQLQDSQAALAVAQAQYQKLLNGSTPEDIKTSQDVRDVAADSLTSAYSDALVTIESAYIKIYNAFTTADSVQKTYFGSGDKEAIGVLENKNKIGANLANVKTYLETAKKSSNRQDIDTALSQTISSLNEVANALGIIRSACDVGVYFTNVSSTDKSSLDDQKGYINTIMTTATDDQQTISADKIALQKAENLLKLKTAGPRQEDIDLYKAQVEQAEAKANLLKQQIQDNYLVSPIDGKITDVARRVGEVVSVNQAVISLLSSNPFEIKVDIYEQDIVDVRPGQSVKINVVAFPDTVFSGKVLSIDPAEKIVDNVVYYEVTIDFGGDQEGIRQGMTADIVIETDKKENVLRVSKSAVEKIDGIKKVQIIKGDKIENRKITTGLEGNDYFEILSGLSEGEQVIAGKK